MLARTSAKNALARSAEGWAHQGAPRHASSVRQTHIPTGDGVKDASPGKLPPNKTDPCRLSAFDAVSGVFMKNGAAVFEGDRNTGGRPWALAMFPKAWRRNASELVDEVWASSQFLVDMYQQATDKPAKLVPLAMGVARMKTYPRRHCGQPTGKFLFLYIFDFSSSVARKNPMAAVQAFKQAFVPTDNSVGLVFKTMNTKPNNPEWIAFLKECQTDRSIQLITDTFDRPEVLGLINACDAYISLHRAEGFGRTMAEAILLGKLVAATNYSGNTDYMDFNHVLVDYLLVGVNEESYQWVSKTDKAYWAEVDIDSASEAFRKLLKRRNTKTAKGIEGKIILNKLSSNEIGKKISEILE